ncbi:MAG: DUF2937 family protein [Gammaproteobacteria bacterium]|nr:DUF2937 family protein [Gammaproteobacteria bacterium]MBQ0839725.1 DUF2937 family protein [Gammaproteobacteria bacterium]
MRKILDYLRLILFTSGVLIGVQVPGFIDQYGKSLEAHLVESTLSLGEFQEDAQRYFDGSLDKLITHYQNNPDPVIQDGGASIAAIYKRNLKLTQAWAAFSKDTYSAYTHVFLKPIIAIKNEVWNNYTYSIVLNQSAIISGLSCGFILSLLIELSCLLLARTTRLLFHRSQRASSSS